MNNTYSPSARILAPLLVATAVYTALRLTTKSQPASLVVTLAVAIAHQAFDAPVARELTRAGL